MSRAIQTSLARDLRRPLDSGYEIRRVVALDLGTSMFDPCAISPNSEPKFEVD